MFLCNVLSGVVAGGGFAAGRGSGCGAGAERLGFWGGFAFCFCCNVLGYGVGFMEIILHGNSILNILNL